MSGGIQLRQAGVTFNAAGAAHPAPIAIAAAERCYVTFVGTVAAPVVYTWTLTPPSGDPNCVMSSGSSPGPSFLPQLDNAGYAIELEDENGNHYYLDIYTPTIPNVPGSGTFAYCTTIAGLRLLNTASSTDTVQVRCYRTLEDGGGGTFMWDPSSTEADNGGTIIQATGVVTGRWKRQFSGSINIRWFGATGDGVTSDTTAIRDAITAVLALTSGGTLDIPLGSFVVDNFLDCTNSDTTKHLNIVGISGASIILADDIEDVFYANPCENITLTGVRVSGIWSRAVNFNNGNNVACNNNYITGGTKQPASGAIAGFELEAITDLQINDNVFRNIGAGATEPRGYAVTSGSGGSVVRVTCKNNNVKVSCWGGGLNFFDIQDYDISFNHVDLMSQAAPAPEVDGFGYCILAYQGAFDVNNGTKRGVIHGNVCRNSIANGILTAASRNVAVTSNICENTCISVLATSLEVGGIGIQGTQEQSVLVKGNSVTNSGQYGYALQGTGIECIGNTAEDCTLSAITLGDSFQGGSVVGNTAWRCARVVDSTAPYVQGVRIVDNHGYDLTGEGFRFTDARECVLAFNHITYPVGSGLVILAGRDNLIDGNHLLLSGAYGFDIRSAYTTVRDNHMRGNVNGAGVFTTDCLDLKQYDNHYEENGDAARVTGTVDIRTFTYDHTPVFINKVLHYTANGTAGSVTFNQALRDFYQLVTWINNTGSDIYASVNSSGHLVIMTRKGGTAATLTIDAGANDAATILGLNGLSDTGAAPAVADILDLSVGARAKLGNQLQTGVVESLAPSLGGTLMVRACSTAGNITLTAAQTINAVVLAAKDRVLLTAQTTPGENGPWVVQSGAWTRPPEFSASLDVVVNCRCIVEEGTNAGLWRLTTAGPYTLGSTGLTWECTFGRGLKADPNPASGRGLWNVTDGGAVPNGGWCSTIHQDDNLVYALAIFDDSTSSTTPGGTIRASTTALLIEPVGNLHLRPVTLVLADTAANSQWNFRMTGTGPSSHKGLFHEQSAGAGYIGGDDFPTNSSTAPNITHHAHSATGTTSTGGNTIIGGDTGTSIHGRNQLKLSTSNMLETVDLVSGHGQRILSRLLITDLTTTNMPANTGDLVGTVGNAATVPTANPTACYIEYAWAGVPYRRHTDGTVD